MIAPLKMINTGSHGVCMVLAALTLGAASGPAFAQSSDFAFEVPGVRNFVAVVGGVVPDYLGSDDYMFAAGPMRTIRFGDSERYVRLVATDLNINLLDSKTWSLGPAVNYRFGRSDVDDKAVDDMKNIDGTVEVGAFGGWKWVSEGDPRHRFSVGTEFLYDVGGEHGGPEFQREVQRLHAKRSLTSLPRSLKRAWIGVMYPRHFLGVRL